jgi:NADH-quinone oxidoreductase subunit J
MAGVYLFSFEFASVTLIFIGEIVTIEFVLFIIFALIGVASALLMISMSNPMKSALLLILNFIALAGIYLTLHAQFVAIMQIIVYAGAIMVLVLFVIMLLNLKDDAVLHETRSWKQYFGLAFTSAMLVLIIIALSSVSSLPYRQIATNATEIGTVENIGKVLYTSFIFPMEITSLLLTAAVIGALVLAKKRFP